MSFTSPANYNAIIMPKWYLPWNSNQKNLSALQPLKGVYILGVFDDGLAS